MSNFNLTEYVNPTLWKGTDEVSAAYKAFYQAALRIIEVGMRSEDGCMAYLTKASNTLIFFKILDEEVEIQKNIRLKHLQEKMRSKFIDDESIKVKTNRLTSLKKKYENEEKEEIKEVLQSEMNELEKEIELKREEKSISEEIKKLDKPCINTKTTDVSKQKTIVKELIDTYVIPLSQNFLMEERKAELDSYEKSYDKAFNLALKMFTEVYDITDPELSAKQLLHSLINCKRGIYGMERKEQTLLALLNTAGGTGKSSFLYSLDRVINKKTTGGTRIEDIVGRFTSSKLNQNFMVFTEEEPRFDTSQTSTLKDIITCEEYSYERKGKDVINLRKNAQLFICANTSLEKLFYADGSSRRLSRIYFNAIKIKMTSEQIDKMIEKIWFATPLSFPYDTMEFVKTYNEKAAEDTAWQDELSILVSKYRSEINDDWINKRHTRREWMDILESKSVSRIEKFLNQTEWFVKGNHQKMNNYKATDELKNIIKDCEEE